MRINAIIGHDHRVFITFHDEELSASFWLTPEEAKEIGAVGGMAAARKRAEEKRNDEGTSEN